MNRYDKLNRLRSADFSYWDNTWYVTQEYGTHYNYDANGNILQLVRRADSNIPFDSLVYAYKSINGNQINQLDFVDDKKSSSSALDDIKPGQIAGNYEYDEIGNLIADDQEDITEISWTVGGKIEYIHADGKYKLEYDYDALGNRIRKRYYEYDNGSYPLTKSTMYVKDASGQSMSIYERAEDTDTTTYQAEIDKYGSSRLGSVTANRSRFATNTSLAQSRELGDRSYTLTDHLGNVRALVSDWKSQNLNDFEPQLLSYSNYYPFGMLMPERSSSAEEQRYGFNGHEKDDELLGVGNKNSTYFRSYDTRLALWNSVDPKNNASESPFVGFSRNPVLYSDLFGDSIEAPDNLFSTSTTGPYPKGYDSDGMNVAAWNKFRDGIYKVSGVLLDKPTANRQALVALSVDTTKGSQSARNFLLTKLNSTSKRIRTTLADDPDFQGAKWLEFESQDEKGIYSIDYSLSQLAIDVNDFDNYVYKGVQPLSHGVGLMFFHELHHADGLGFTQDRSDSAKVTAELLVIKQINVYRKQMNLTPRYESYKTYHSRSGVQFIIYGPKKLEDYTDPKAAPKVFFP